LTQTKDALGNLTAVFYDAVGNVLASRDANLHTTNFVYDELNRRTITTDAENNVTQLQYDGGVLSGCGNCGATPGSSFVTQQTDPNGKVTYFKYDALNRLIGTVRKEGDTADVIDSGDAVTSYTYDPNNNRTSLKELNGNITVYQYDALNRRTKETNAAGDVTMTSYDGVGNVTSVTAPTEISPQPHMTRWIGR
jgi:YD repeat-containing protein